MSGVTALIVDIGWCLAGRIACLGLANAHLDPAHLEALRAAAVELEDHLPVAFPNLARRANAARPTEEFRSGACHAGRFEGSIVLAEAVLASLRGLGEELAGWEEQGVWPEE